MRLRAAEIGDAPAVAAIYNEGIAGRDATFETRPRRPEELASRIAGPLPAVVAELDAVLVGAAWLAPYSEREAYVGVAECSVYVRREARSRGIGTALLEALAAAAAEAGLHKLLGKLFPTNEASVRLVARCGFREVGLHLRHGRLEGEWRDVLLVERLLGDAAAPDG